MTIDLGRIFDAAPSPFVLMEPDSRIVWMNAAYLAATGRTAADLIGRKMTEAFPSEPDSAPDRMLRGSMERAVTRKQEDHLPLIVYPITGADGTMQERRWSATHTPILDDAGEVIYLLQNTIDITGFGSGPPDITSANVLSRTDEVARQNARLGIEREFLRTVFDQAPSFIAVLIGPDHVFQLVNHAYLQLVGHRNLIGKTVREAMPDIQGQGYFELLDEVYRSGAPYIASAAPVTLQSEPGGPVENKFVDLIYQPLRGPEGGVSGIFVQGHDVTEQKRAEDAATESEHRFRVMAEAMPSQVWTALPDGSFDWINAQVETFLGLRETEIRGGVWAAHLHPDDSGRVLAGWRRALSTGSRFETDFRLRDASGAYRWHLARAVPVRGGSGNVLRWVGTNTDIHDQRSALSELEALNASLEERVEERRRELEAAQEALRQSQRMEAIGNLAGGIAHDFNNLLQVVAGSVQLTARQIDPDARERAQLDLAMSAVMRGSTLANQLLAFGRRQPLQPKTINLARLVRDADRLIRHSIGEAIEVRTLIGDDLWNTFADPANVETALLNLAINARDAMGGRGRLTIELTNATLDPAYVRRHPDLDAGDYVMLAVTDTGSGIAPEIADKVFEPFFTTKSAGKGTGLGLSMVYGFVKQSGGHVRLYSEPGEGTTIRLYLPRSRAAEEVVVPVAAGPMVGGTERVLVVEDDPEVRRTAVSLLGDLGYAVIEAPNAEAALPIVEGAEPIDLLFTDVIMPGRLQSRELAERAKVLRPDIAVLYTSGYTQDSIVHDGRLDPDVKLLAKPYSQEELAQKLREVLGPPAAETPAPTQAGGPGGALSGLRVIVVEDDPFIRLNLVQTLEDWGAEVRGAGTGAGALETAPEAVDLLVVDVGLPDMPGTLLAGEIRKYHPEVPVLFATGRNSVDGLDEMTRAGQLTKPYSDELLLGAIRRLLV